MNSSDLVKIVQSHGLSRRKAWKVVQTIVDSWSAALRRGEAVEMPGGWCTAIRWSRPKSGVRLLKRVTGNERHMKPYLRSRGQDLRALRFRPTVEFDSEE